MSHIPHLGDAASPAVDVDVSAGDALSPAGDFLASPNFGICNTAQKIKLNSDMK